MVILIPVHSLVFSELFSKKKATSRKMLTLMVPQRSTKRWFACTPNPALPVCAQLQRGHLRGHEKPGLRFSPKTPALGRLKAPRPARCAGPGTAAARESPAGTDGQSPGTGATARRKPRRQGSAASAANRPANKQGTRSPGGDAAVQRHGASHSATAALLPGLCAAQPAAAFGVIHSWKNTDKNTSK